MSEQNTFDLSAADLETLVRKMKKARDSYSAMNEMEAYVGWGERGELLWHLTKTGILDTWNHPHLWSNLVEARAHANAKDVARFLSKVETYDLEADVVDDVGYDDYDDAYYDEGYDESYEQNAQPAFESQRLVDFWPSALDDLAMAAYAEDPSAFDEHVDAFAEPVAKGFKLVLRRFGKIDKGALPDGVVSALAAQHVDKGGLPWAVFVAGDGEAVRLELRGAKTTKEEFHGFIELFGSLDDWKRAVLDQALAAEYAPSFELTEDAWPIADLDQLTQLLAAGSLYNEAVNKVYGVLLDARDDSPEELLSVARTLRDEHNQNSQAEICATAAILKCKRAARAIPAGAESVLSLTSPGSQPNRHNYTALEPVLEALGYLDEEQRVARLLEIFEGQYTGSYAFQGVQSAPHNERLLAAAFAKAEEMAAVESANFSSMTPVANGLAMIGASILPAVEEAYGATDNALARDGYRRAIIYVLSDLADAGEVLPERYDRFVSYVGWRQENLGAYSFGHYVVPDLNKVVAALPKARAEALLLDQLDAKNPRWARAFEGLGHCATDALFERAFSLLEEHGLPAAEDNFNWFERMLGALGDEVTSRVGRVLANSDSVDLHNSVKRVVGDEAYEKMLAEVGAESAADKSKTDKIARLSAAYLAKNPDAGRRTVYFFERLDQQAAPTDLNRIGGRPVGIDADSWPRKDGDADQPMQHMFTLDMATVPALQGRVGEGVRALSLFVHQPSYNEAWEPYNSDTAVVLLSEDEVVNGPFEADLPAGDDQAYKFSVQEAEVPADVFLDVSWDEERDPELGVIRTAIYQCNAWAGGEPIWLQSDESPSFDFVMQFDEGFVYMNLGDCGVMYVYPQTAFWQCH